VSEESNSYWSAISPYWFSLNESWDHGPSAFIAESQSVPPPILDLYAAHWFQSEVNNGGLHQFFFNSTGILAPEAASALKAIGLREWSAVLLEAMQYFGEPYPRERMSRIHMLPKMVGQSRDAWDPFLALDERFFGCADSERNVWESAFDEYALQFV